MDRLAQNESVGTQGWDALAPELPRRMRMYTYDRPDPGSMLEVRGARELTGLPEQLIALSTQLGVRLTFHRSGSTSSVLLTLPANEG